MRKYLSIKLVDAEKYQVVAEQLTGRDGVQRVVDQRKTLETFFLVMNRASWITGGLAAIMAVAAVLLISTTIRLSAMSRSKETEIMRLVGEVLSGELVCCVDVHLRAPVT